MDILLSLPIASYFFSTSVTSWSTSLNLLFFYMTWSTLVLTHSPIQIELIGTTAIRLVFWLIPSLLFLLFDNLIPSVARTIKHNGASALPPTDFKTLSRLLALALFNLALETAVEAGLSLGLSLLLKQPVFRTSTTLPLPWQIAKQLALLFTLREILTYYTHRYWLHGTPPPAPPSTISKRVKLPKAPKPRYLPSLHKSYAHRYRSPPFALQVRVDHPFSFLLHRFVPTYLPALILRNNLHLLTFFVFLALTTAEETLSHSSYTIIPGVIMGGITRRTCMHYTGRKPGNYGTWGVLDWVHGTGLGKRDVWDDVRDEASKHQLRERGEDLVDDAGGKVEKALRRSKRNLNRSKSGKRGMSNKRGKGWMVEDEDDSEGDWVP
ncbi:uncharacterized protein PODANS_6_10580 [Podospora anserina S mat+]|uniref:Podospora anserina S mat+ genomic DNA chromosome 6, supercontig 4 n=1 Tax=Podospora anserina (strain S / ATCC MYA-4624 / DSM 980 / FGSC 10383) TaxID=515849 RepID=B2ANI5_PODAN|nr:uncharacterized protein PODANS_6_10580 [Podospora anserina S mat+]CAP65566.1 unnamed protein product [Podospora anserina S mat+]CDP31561.1 Putative protein of unknown function [Podospora anserina S mat+]